jgi:hypothetical protein
MSGRNSAVECQLPKLDVAGSTPVARSNFSRNSTQLQSSNFRDFDPNEKWFPQKSIAVKPFVHTTVDSSDRSFVQEIPIVPV